MLGQGDSLRSRHAAQRNRDVLVAAEAHTCSRSPARNADRTGLLAVGLLLVNTETIHQTTPLLLAQQPVVTARECERAFCRVLTLFQPFEA